MKCPVPGQAVDAAFYDVISRSATLGPVPMRPYLDSIAASLRSSLLGAGDDIAIAVEAEALSIGADYAVTIGLIVDELATNAVKYAFPCKKGRLVLGFVRRDGEAILTIADDGVGVAATTRGAPFSGKGSHFVEAFVR